MHYSTKLELLRAFDAIEIYRQIDLMRNVSYYFSPNTAKMIKITPPQEFLRPIYDAKEKELAGYISKLGDTVTISLLGLEGQFSRTYYLFSSFKGGDFYGLSCPIADGVKFFYNNLHKNLQEILTQYPDIMKINISGYSYGSMIGQLTALVVHKLCKFHRGDISEKGHELISRLYEVYFESKTWLGLNVFDEKTTTIDDIIAHDKLLFDRVSLWYGCFFGAVNAFEESVLHDPDFITIDIADKQSFADKINVYILNNDPVGNILDRRTLVGSIVSMMHREVPRILIGRVHILATKELLPHHNYTYYLETIAEILRRGKKVRYFSPKHIPQFMLFQTFLLPYASIDFIPLGGQIGISSLVHVVLALGMDVGAYFGLQWLLHG